MLPNENWPSFKNGECTLCLLLLPLFMLASPLPLWQPLTKPSTVRLSAMADNVIFFTIPLGFHWITVTLKTPGKEKKPNKKTPPNPKQNPQQQQQKKPNQKTHHPATAWLKNQVRVTQHFTSSEAQIHSSCKAQGLPDTNILIAGARGVFRAPGSGTCLKISYSSNA